ncbi:MAG: YncE family protein [Xanthomonadaceae bacterium]|nr:YncE family protein [Xanthomonadaceae bacterium]
MLAQSAHPEGAVAGVEGAQTKVIESGGLRVEATLKPLAESADGLQAEDPVELSLDFRYADSGEPLIGAYPAAWLDLLAGDVDGSDETTCRQAIAQRVGGGLMSASEVDFNEYLVLTLDNEASVSVVDPRFSFGGSRLLARVPLDAPGVDARLDVGRQPGRMAIQPDGAFLWVTHGADGGQATGGVTVVDTRGLRILRQIETGTGPHDIAFSDDNRRVFVVNRGEQTVSVLSVAELRHLGDVKTGRFPTSVAWSKAGGLAWVAHADGTLAAIDPETLAVSARINPYPESPPSRLGRVSFEAQGRFAFVPAPDSRHVHIIDTARQQLIRTVEVEESPIEIGFSDQLAYVAHLGSPIVMALSLEGLDDPDGNTVAIEIPIGQGPTASAARPFGTASVVPAPGAAAMLFAHGADRAVYYYMEGMAAPMGSFTTSRLEARALMVLDRSLREQQPGLYTGKAGLGRPGTHQLALFLDSPRWMGCFQVEVARNPELEARRLQRQPLVVELLPGQRQARPGQSLTIEVRLSDPNSGEPVSGIQDALGLTVLSPGVWQQRHDLAELGDGRYQLTFEPPESGVYYVSFASASRGLGFGKSPFVTVHVGTEPPANAGHP